MMRKSLLVDLAILCILFLLGAAIYFMSPRTASFTTTNTTSMHTDAPAGLNIVVLTEGTGPEALNGQTVVVDYTGTLQDGTVFDSSIPRGEPFIVHLGAGEVIKGWDLGLVGMKVGETRRLTIAPELAYGKEGFPGVIPENATLTFEITLRAIQ